MARSLPIAVVLLFVLGCRPAEPPATEKSSPAGKPALLLVTLDTTRADAVVPEVAPRLVALGARGLVFRQAYSTAPSTLTAHTSMMSGLYPAGHGIHENGRRVAAGLPLLAEDLKKAGYATAAFVSGFPLDAQFGLARGFDVYDDDFAPGAVERSAKETTARALAYLAARKEGPAFVWVHYFDPHEPYAPPEPWRAKFAADPYRGEIAAMDEQLGRLIDAFEAATSGQPRQIVVLADHGEGRGDHGEQFHGNLLYQGVIHVPLILAGDGIEPGTRDDVVSTRQIRATLLGWARGEKPEGSLLVPNSTPVLGEAMQPFLNYRWQPQVMAIADRIKLIRSGRFEAYDVIDDPREENDLAATMDPDRQLARAIADYPLPSSGPPAASTELSEEESRKLASLGYVSANETPKKLPEGAPRAADMTHLFADLDAASHDFVAGNYAATVSRFEKILKQDPGNLMAAVRLAVGLSLLGRDREAEECFEQAKRIDKDSIEVRHYLAMHQVKKGRGELAAPLFEEVLAAQPTRYAALAALAEIREKQGNFTSAAELWSRALEVAAERAKVLSHLGQVRMELGDTEGAIAALEEARSEPGETFRHDLELGVLLMAQSRFEEARAALDRVPADHPGKAMLLFKRAQLSVLLAENDRADKVKQALEGADAETSQLIATERLFQGLLPP